MFFSGNLFLLILTVGVVYIEAIPVSYNYTTDLLRLAKASEIKAYLDEDQSPCDNFYKFACGKWPKLHPAPAKGKSANLDQLKYLYNRKCADMLASNDPIDSGVDIKIKNFYESCLEAPKIDRSTLENIMNEVDLNGGWPQITNPQWYDSNYDWLKVVAKIRRNLGMDVLIGLKLVPDFQDKDRYRIMVGAPDLYLTQDAYLLEGENQERLRTAYIFSIQMELQRYFPEMSEQWCYEVAQQVLHVEKDLAAGFDRPDYTLQQKTRLRYTAELMNDYGNVIDISRYLSLIYNSSIYAQVYESTNYFPNFAAVLNRTPKLTIANYTMWKVLNKLSSGNHHYSKNKEYCVNKVMQYFPEALENMFARNYHTMQMSNDLQSVWSDIKRTFREELQTSNELTWMDSMTKRKFLEKLNAMEFELSSTDAEYAKLMQNLLITKTNYYKNLIAIWRWQTALELAKLNEKPQEPEEKYLLPHYVYEVNKIKVPITFLQSRFLWDPAYPHALLYSNLGYLLAQQMMKAFDLMGRTYDAHGNKNSWMETLSSYHFESRAKCYVQQYSNYSFPNWVRYDEDKLTNTCVSDNAALSISYQAYTKWWLNVANNISSEQETLPLLDKYSSKQLFYIGYAQLWCADYAADIPDYEEIPERWRVIGALVNLNEFAKDYECSVGSKMNPEQKCVLY